MCCPCPPTIAWPLQNRVYLDGVEVLNLATGESSMGPKLPAAASSGCAAFDSSSGFVYYVEGVRRDGSQQGLYRIAGESKFLRACLSLLLRACLSALLLPMFCFVTLPLECAAGYRGKGAGAWCCCIASFGT